MIKSCLKNPNNIASKQLQVRVVFTPYSPLAYTDLFVNAKPKHTHKRMKHTINTVVL